MREPPQPFMATRRRRQSASCDCRKSVPRVAYQHRPSMTAYAVATSLSPCRLLARVLRGWHPRSANGWQAASQPVKPETVSMQTTTYQPSRELQARLRPTKPRVLALRRRATKQIALMRMRRRNAKPLRQPKPKPNKRELKSRNSCASLGLQPKRFTASRAKRGLHTRWPRTTAQWCPNTRPHAPKLHRRPGSTKPASAPNTQAS
ncbi:hypothetical protein ACEQUB_02547 [Ralstonia syzygii]